MMNNKVLINWDFVKRLFGIKGKNMKDFADMTWEELRDYFKEHIGEEESLYYEDEYKFSNFKEFSDYVLTLHPDELENAEFSIFHKTRMSREELMMEIEDDLYP